MYMQMLLPAHAGAMIISQKHIKAAGCILPISHDTDIPKSLGLRHRAALGISQKSVERYLKEWREAELTQRVSHGHYRKTYPQTDKPSQPSREGITSTNNAQDDDIQP